MRGRRRNLGMRAITLASAALCAAAVLALPPAASTGSATRSALPPRACTEIGCTSGLFLDVTPIAKTHPRARKATLCVARTCRTFRLGPRRAWQSVVSPGLEGADEVRVRLTVRGRRGKVIARSAVRAPVRRVQPNGEDCPPTCFQVGAELRRDATLVRSA